MKKSSNFVIFSKNPNFFTDSNSSWKMLFNDIFIFWKSPKMAKIALKFFFLKIIIESILITLGTFRHRLLWAQKSYYPFWDLKKFRWRNLVLNEVQKCTLSSSYMVYMDNGTITTKIYFLQKPPPFRPNLVLCKCSSTFGKIMNTARCLCHFN